MTLIETVDSNLKHFVKIISSTKYSNGFVLEAKIGKIIVQSPINGNINLWFKRISGNGKIVINSLNNVIVKSLNIISKISESYCISCTEDTVLEIFRTPDSVGEVSLFGISFETDENVAKKWKNLINKFDNFNGIKIIDNKLIALQGGFLEPANIIESIKTNPPELSNINDNKLYFKYRCEIEDLILAQSKLNEKIDKPIFINREPPTQITVPLQSIEVNKLNSNSIISSVKQNIESIKSFKEKVIYDSQSVNGINRKYFSMFKDKTVKFVESAKQNYIAIKPGGNFNLNIANLEPNNYYLVVINGKKLSGNGKIKVGFSSGGNLQESKLINFDGSQVDRSIDLKIGNKSYPEEQFKLHIISPSDATGEVIISRIMIINSLLNELPYNQAKSNYNSVSMDFNIEYSSQNSNFDFSVKNSTRKASLFFKENLEKIESLPFNFYPQNFNSCQYILSIINQSNDSRVVDFYNQFDGFDKSSKSDIAFTKIGEIKPASKIFLEEWGPLTSLSNDDINNLLKCSTVITPSIRNYFILKHTLKNVNIILGSKLRFIPRNIQFNPKKYWIYFEKHQEFTSKIIDIWEPTFPPLYIVGSNINTPMYINKISEHESYFNIISLLLNSAGYLDFNSCMQYRSSWIDLALNLGCTVLTNNCEYTNSAYIHNISINDNIEKSNIIDIILNPIKKEVNWSYNLKVIKNIKDLIGETNA